ncbi:MAG: hypothetical protein WBO19_07200, partial [Terriglobia bacterium]
GRAQENSGGTPGDARFLATVGSAYLPFPKLLGTGCCPDLNVAPPSWRLFAGWKPALHPKLGQHLEVSGGLFRLWGRLSPTMAGRPGRSRKAGPCPTSPLPLHSEPRVE